MCSVYTKLAQYEFQAPPILKIGTFTTLDDSINEGRTKICPKISIEG